MHTNKGRQRCDLYIVRNCPFPNNSDDDMNGLVAYIANFYDVKKAMSMLISNLFINDIVTVIL